MQNWTIENGQALIAEGLENEQIHLSEGKFCAEASSEATRIDASDCYILPGIIDVHGDAFERIIEPRPGVHFDKKVALKEADNQMIANGITTAYHGLGVSWEPGVRAMDASRKFFNAWLEIRDRASSV